MFSVFTKHQRFSPRRSVIFQLNSFPFKLKEAQGLRSKKGNTICTVIIINYFIGIRDNFICNSIVTIYKKQQTISDQLSNKPYV